MPHLTLFDELLLVLALLYAFECVAWTGWGSWVCAAYAGLPRRPRQPAEFPANARGGAAFSGVLPTDVGFVGEHIPLALSPEGILGEAPCHPHPVRRTPGTGLVLKWDGLPRIAARGNEVHAGGDVLVRHLAPESARRLAALLRRLAALAPADRERAIRRHFDRSLDAREASRRAKRWLKASLFQRAMALCSFLFLFVGAPLGEHLFGLTHHWMLMAFLFLWWHLLAASSVSDLHAFFFPAQRGERAKRVMSAFLSPAAAMCSSNLAAQGLMAGLHPLAVAAGTCSRKQWEPALAFSWRDAHHPLPAETTDPAGRRILDWHRAAWRGAVERFLCQRGVAAADCARPQSPFPETTRSCCPRCLAAFAQENARCTACENMATRPLHA